MDYEAPKPGDLGPIIGLTFEEHKHLSEIASDLALFDAVHGVTLRSVDDGRWR